VIIADLEEKVFKFLRGKGVSHEDAHAMATHARSTADTLSEFGPKDGPRAGEYLKVWLKILEGHQQPSEAWGIGPYPPPPSGETGQGPSGSA
jgi:hypothetical protein